MKAKAKAKAKPSRESASLAARPTQEEIAANLLLIYWVGWVYCIGIALLIPLFTDRRIHWLNRAAKRVATYSYGIYLLHVPALYIVFSLWQSGALALKLVLFAAITAALAIIAYHAIEAPMIRLASRGTQARRPT